MIDFICPHCAHPYSVEDNLEGRAMRCKACEGFLTVPKPGGKAQSRELTPEEQVSFLRHLLRIAERRYQRREERAKRTQELAQALYRKYKELRVDFDERERFLQIRQARMEETKEQLDRVLHDLTAAVQARGKAEGRLDEALLTLAKVSEERDEARRSLAALEEAVAQARVDAEAGREARAELERVRAELDATKRELAAVQERMAAAAGEPKLAIARQESLEREIARLTKDLEAERAARAQAELDCRAVAAEAGQQRERLARLEEELRARSEDAGIAPHEHEALRVRLAESEELIRQVREELASALTAYGEANGRLDHMTRENERLHAELAAVQGAEAELADRLSRAEQQAALVEALKSDRDEARAGLMVAQAELEKLRVEVAQLSQSKGKAKSAASDEVVRLQSELLKERELRHNLEATARAAVLRAEHAEAELPELRNRLEAAQATADRASRLEAALEVEHARVTELEAMVERFMEDLCASTRAQGAVETRLDERSQAVEQLAAELGAERVARAEAEARCEEAEQRLARTMEELAALRERTSASDERLFELERLVEQTQDRLAVAQARLEEAERRAGQARSSGVSAESNKSVTLKGVDDGVIFIPEVVDGAAAEEDAMIETLLRFIEPE